MSMLMIVYNQLQYTIQHRTVT